MKHGVNKTIPQASEHLSEKFSIGSMIYIRLRRSTGRVIDVMYVSENNEYAKYVMTLALATADEELHRLAYRLKNILPEDVKKIDDLAPLTATPSDYASDEPTAEDIYREQVSHRYIGSLR